MHSRRSILCSTLVLAGSLTGCSTEESEASQTRLDGLSVVNIRNESQAVHVAIENGDEVTYRETRTIRADSGRRWADLPTGPFERETLYAWTDDRSRSAATTFEFGDYSKECVSLQVLIEDSAETSGEPRTSMLYSSDCGTTESDRN